MTYEMHLEAVGLAATINSAVHFGVGYVWGRLTGRDEWLAAQAFAIYAFVNTILRVSVDVMSGGKEANPKTYYFSLITSEGILGAISILVFRQLRLIGPAGTFICAAGLWAKELYHLSELQKRLDQ